MSVVASGVPAIGAGVIGTAPGQAFEPLRFAFDTLLGRRGRREG